MEPDENPTDQAVPEATAATAEDETRRKFREALERKHAQHSGAGTGGGEYGAAGHTHTGPAKTQRTFRRKSG